jgi:hypothetical protein
MSEIRIKCSDCDRMILPATASRNGGLCGRCAKLSPSERAAKRAFVEALKAGTLYRPNPGEMATALPLADVEPKGSTWSPHGEYYAGTEDCDLASIVDDATQASQGYVVLLSDSGSTFVLAFNDMYGVCEYRNEEAGKYLLAYTPENASAQIPYDLHLGQICACCGVELLWYPSRYHMPRHRAFACLNAVLHRAAEADVQWLDAGDFSETSRGRG